MYHFLSILAKFIKRLELFYCINLNSVVYLVEDTLDMNTTQVKRFTYKLALNLESIYRDSKMNKTAIKLFIKPILEFQSSQ